MRLMIMTENRYDNIGEILYTGELPNGLKIMVVPKPGFSSFYAVFGTNYGGAMRNFCLDGRDIKTPAGVAHFLEHKMFDMPEGDNALEQLSANGADPNAFTSGGVTMYYFSCTDNFEDNLKLLLRFVSTPYFTDETVQKEQGIISQEIRMVDDHPGSAIYYNTLSLLYDHHPIKDKVAGSIESIAEITAQTLYDCHKMFYTPANMVLCVEGDVDPEHIYDIAEAIVTAEKSPVPKADYGEPETLIPLAERCEVEMEVALPQFYIASKLKTLPGGREDLKERLTGSLALRLLAGPSSPFFARLYSDGTLSRDFDSDVDYTAGTATMFIGGESSDPDRVFSQLKAEVERVITEGFGSEYFERTKKATIGQSLRNLEDFDNVCVGLAMDSFCSFCSFDSLELLEGINEEDCIAWIAESLAPERLVISIINPVKVK